MQVSDILRSKGTEVYTIRAEKTVFDAINALVKKNVGSLLVLDGKDHHVAGIITERDILKETHRRPGKLKSTPVADVMTKKLLVASPGDDLEYVQAVMTKNHVRHLPVIEGKDLKGMISIGDVVKLVHRQIEVENRDLKDYISGRYQD